METGEAGSSRPPLSDERRDMTKVKIVAPQANAMIDDDSVIVYVLDGIRNDGVYIPMSRCELVNVDKQSDMKGATFVLATKSHYADDHPPYRNIKYVHLPCDKVVDDGVIICHCSRIDMFVAVLEIMRAVGIINNLYLKYHEASPATIKEIATTMNLIGKARKIIGKRHDETKIYVPVPRD